MTLHSASVRSVEYRWSSRLCCRRVAGVHMTVPDQVSAPSWNHLGPYHSTPRTLIGRTLRPAVAVYPTPTASRDPRINTERPL